MNVQPWVTVGNSLSGTLPTSPIEWIGTINAADWIIKTNSTERMRVLSTGNVGIGTATPASKLDVEGGVSIGATYSGTTAAPSNGAIIEGSVGIGTTSPGAKLGIAGGDIEESDGTNGFLMHCRYGSGYDYLAAHTKNIWNIRF